MADFFTRLAERTLGLANTIQPVLPSLFAPGAPLLDTEPEAPVEEHDSQPQAWPRNNAYVEQVVVPEPTRSEQPAAPRRAISQPDDQTAPTTQPAAPSRSNAASDHESNIGRPRAEMLIQPSATSRVPVGTGSERTEPAADRSQGQASNTTIGIRQNLEPQPAAERSDPIAPRSLVPRQQIDAAAPSRAAHAPAHTAERPATQNVRPATPAALTRPELVAHEQTMARIEATPRPPEPTPVEAAPHIHVSIGRIEVRAVTPPPAPTPQPKPAAAPRMSLDDYLRSQKGGRR